MIKKIPMHHLEEYLKDLQNIDEKYDKAEKRLKINAIIFYTLLGIIAVTIFFLQFK